MSKWVSELPSNDIRSNIAFVKSTPTNLLFLANAFDNCASLKLTPEKSAFAAITPDKSLPEPSI